MASLIRIGAVEYLNTKPLICDLELLAPEAELVLELPSRLAVDLAAGKLEVALIPVIEYFRADGYTLIPNIAIASRGAVLSVTVFSRVPWPKIRAIALDEGSRTSATLARILLKRRYGVAAQVVPLPMHQPAEEASADAVLLIGDRAMRAALPGFAYSYDLGQEWQEWTGLPFVYAVWAVRPGVDLGAVAGALAEAKRRGQERVAQIAYFEAKRLGLDPAYCRRYLTNIICFDMGPKEIAGLSHYYELARDLGLAPPGVELAFYQNVEAAAV